MLHKLSICAIRYEIAYHYLIYKGKYSREVVGLIAYFALQIAFSQPSNQPLVNSLTRYADRSRY